jgi:nucleotide-binding universal stress UspA family protein
MAQDSSDSAPSNPSASNPSASNPSAFARILVGLDGTSGSARALAWVKDVAAPDATLVIAAHVITPSRAFAKDLSFEGLHSWRRDLERQLRSTWVAPLRAAGIRCECRFVEAESTVDGLVAVADREQVDLIVVGTRGHRHATNRVLGGVSYTRAHQPVVVVPAAWTASTPAIPAIPAIPAPAATPATARTSAHA